MLKNARQFGRWVKSKERVAETAAPEGIDVVAHDEIAMTPVLETKRAPKSKKTTKRKASKS